MAKRDPDARGHALAEALNDDLNEEFEVTAEYRVAVEEVVSFFESVLAGLDADAEKDEVD